MFWFIKRLCNAGSIFMTNIPSGGHRCGYWLQPASPSSPGGFLGMGKVRHGTWRSTPTKRVTLCRTKWCAPLMHRNPAVLGQQYHFYTEISEYTLRFFFKLVNLHKKVAFFFLAVSNCHHDCTRTWITLCRWSDVRPILFPLLLLTKLNFGITCIYIKS